MTAAARAAASLETFDDPITAKVIPFPRPKRKRHQFDLTNHLDWVAGIGSKYSRAVLYAIANNTGHHANLSYIAKAVGCALSTASELTDKFDALGLIFKTDVPGTGRRDKRRECHFAINPGCPPPPPPPPRAMVNVSVFRNKAKPESPLASPITPSSSTETPTRAREAEAKQEEGKKQNRKPAKPADAGSSPAPSWLRQMREQHQRWARRNPEPAIKKSRWCRKQFHWVKDALARGDDNVTGDDLELLDEALFIADNGNWCRNLSPAQRRRINELDRIRQQTPPIEHEMPEDRRRRERMQEAPIGGRRAPAADPTATIAAVNARIEATMRAKPTGRGSFVSDGRDEIEALAARLRS